MDLSVLYQAKEAKIKENQFLKSESLSKLNNIKDLQKIKDEKNQLIVSVENRLESLKLEEIKNRDLIINSEEENKQIEYKILNVFKLSSTLIKDIELMILKLEELREQYHLFNEEVDGVRRNRDNQVKYNERARGEITYIEDEYERNLI